MIGVFDVGLYVPRYWLDGKTVGKAWGRPGRGQKAVANFDEDSATMGVAAALDCLGNQPLEDVGALFFASTTSPYLEKQVASTVAAAVDLPLANPAQFFGFTKARRTQFAVSVFEEVLCLRAFEVAQGFDNVLFDVIDRVVMVAMCAAERFGNDRVN